MNLWWIPLVLVAFAMLAAYLIYLRQENDDQLTAWRGEEERALAELSIQVSDLLHSVDGVSATTVDRSEEATTLDSGHVHLLSVKRILRNPPGEYFLWMWNSGGQRYVKHVSQVTARVVLKGKYIPPRGGAGRRLKG